MLLIFAVVFGCTTLKAQTGNDKNNFSIRIFKNDTLKNNSSIVGFGYNIFQKGTLYIHQPVIPAIAGNKGFASANDARKIAELMVYKMNHHIFPPAVSVGELDSLKVPR
ncbi:MAG: DUF4907 domain-containing protein [Ferruginibacter sp.]